MTDPIQVRVTKCTPGYKWTDVCRKRIVCSDAQRTISVCNSNPERRRTTIPDNLLTHETALGRPRHATLSYRVRWPWWGSYGVCGGMRGAHSAREGRW